ncbi:helix-turn-helix transcriptional regulator [Streptomyces sp. NBC_01808]|uniref:helix-turn-helix domain-containing protein n=1 Tax=Streptomyces sp. NBC_01808 TaxID=2975947 RepID=UPI002DD92D4C|nr:helix-turn-helix transcriptional regulator [Streptomyces sp. NBC_01808]WSA37876.1 helix-turn-helix transcriptional regulator [Streptomyces sp. NBC_01808]
MTQKRATPTIKRRRVGGQLRRWMGSMKSGDAARLMGWDTTRLSRILRGTYRISGDDVRTFCGKLGVDDPAGVDEVARVAEEPIGEGWWAAYARRIGQNYLDFIELEAEAQTLQIQHPVIIPGLLQSPGYVREMITRRPTTVSPAQAEMLVSIRLARQAVLSKAAKLHALVPESALHATFDSGPAIMRDQIRKLLDASQMTNVDLQLIPLTAHPTYGSNGAITVLSYKHPWANVASVDSPLGGNHTDDAQQVSYLEKEFTAIAEVALPVDKSRDVLYEYLEGQRK